jgi:hypothetical protein
VSQCGSATLAALSAAHGDAGAGSLSRTRYAGLSIGAMPVRSCPIRPSPQRNSSPVRTRNGSARPWRLSTTQTTYICRSILTPAWLGRSRLGSAAVTQKPRYANWRSGWAFREPTVCLNLTRRLEARLKASPELSEDLAEIMRQANAPTDGTQPAGVTRASDSRRLGRAKTKDKA